MSDNEDDSKSNYYFKMGDAVEELSDAYGAKEKTIAGTKLVGKALFNTALFTGKLGLSFVKAMPAILEEKAREAEKNKK